MNSFKIGRRLIGQYEPTYFIAEIGSNFDGSLQRAKDLIYLAKEVGADAAKFQHYSAKTLVSDVGFMTLKSNSDHQLKWKKSVYETYNDASLDYSWTEELKKTCDEVGIDFMTSA